MRIMVKIGLAHLSVATFAVWAAFTHPSNGATSGFIDGGSTGQPSAPPESPAVQSPPPATAISPPPAPSAPAAPSSGIFAGVTLRCVGDVNAPNWDVFVDRTGKILTVGSTQLPLVRSNDDVWVGKRAKTISVTGRVRGEMVHYDEEELVMIINRRTGAFIYAQEWSDQSLRDQGNVNNKFRYEGSCFKREQGEQRF